MTSSFSRRAGVGLLLGSVCLIAPAHAAMTVVIEPVFKFVPGSGPAETVFGLSVPPEFLSNPGADGVGPPDASRPWEGGFISGHRPGDVFYYPAGYPADPGLQSVVRFYNNTNRVPGDPGYNMTSFELRIVGQAYEPNPFEFDFLFPGGPCSTDIDTGADVCFDPDIDIVFGDVDGGGIGVGPEIDAFSPGPAIFGDVTLSADAKTVTFSDGLIPIAGRFTDYILLQVLSESGVVIPPGELPEGFRALAAIEAEFGGSPVPVPTAFPLMASALAALSFFVRRRRAPRA